VEANALIRRKKKALLEAVGLGRGAFWIQGPIVSLTASSTYAAFTVTKYNCYSLPARTWYSI